VETTHASPPVVSYLVGVTPSAELGAFLSIARFSLELDGKVVSVGGVGQPLKYPLDLVCQENYFGCGLTQTTAGKHRARMLAELPGLATQIPTAELEFELDCSGIAVVTGSDGGVVTPPGADAGVTAGPGSPGVGPAAPTGSGGNVSSSGSGCLTTSAPTGPAGPLAALFLIAVTLLARRRR
jgi:MYXO-CTERM domain-containing protein